MMARMKLKIETYVKLQILLSISILLDTGIILRDKDFGITLSNRSGLMDNAEYKIPPLKEALKNPALFFVYIFSGLPR